MIYPAPDTELYERCLNIALRMLEPKMTYGDSSISSYGRGVAPKYNEDEVIKLADKLYEKMRNIK